MVDQLEKIWNQILQMLAVFVTPNWGDAIGWLPLLLVVGVIGPIVTIVMLVWVWYFIRKPRPKVEFADPRRPADRDARGNPIYPTGEPYCPRDAIIYEPGLSRCEICGEGLRVACPKCGVERGATIDTCGNCGLTFSLKPRARVLRPAGPPRGGAAAA
ncbi:MAG: DUF3149 domain-containing protein [Chloroflexota bacterium]